MFRHYSYGLEKTFRPDLFKDFQRLARDELAQGKEKEQNVVDAGVYPYSRLVQTGQYYGLEKLWGFMTYHKHPFTIRLDDDLKAELAKYKKASDFPGHNKV